MSEEYYFIDGDGNTFQVSPTNERELLFSSGLGMPKPAHFTQGIPNRHDRRYLGYRYQPRVINLLVLDMAADRDEMWEHHQEWLDAFNLGKGVGQLKVILSDGSERRLWCYFNDALDLDAADRPQRSWQKVVLQVIAFDPLWFDPVQESESGNFGATPPEEITLNNVGHIESYPVITIAGAVNNPKLTLVTTDEFIQFNYNLTAGHLDIDCGEGTVKLDDALMDPLKLTKASTLFYIPLGAQHVKLTATSGTGLVTVKWYSRFLGI